MKSLKESGSSTKKEKNRRVSNAALANAALVLSSKSGKKYSRWGELRKINPKCLGPAFSLCRRAGIDAALAKADFFFAGAPTIENKIEQKTQNAKVASAKVAFDAAEKKLTRPPPKEDLLGNFSGLKEKLSRSVVDTKTL